MTRVNKVNCPITSLMCLNNNFVLKRICQLGQAGQDRISHKFDTLILDLKTRDFLIPFYIVNGFDFFGRKKLGLGKRGGPCEPCFLGSGQSSEHCPLPRNHPHSWIPASCGVVRFCKLSRGKAGTRFSTFQNLCVSSPGLWRWRSLTKTGL